MICGRPDEFDGNVIVCTVLESSGGIANWMKFVALTALRLACAMALLSEPAPAVLVLVTVKVAARALVSPNARGRRNPKMSRIEVTELREQDRAIKAGGKGVCIGIDKNQRCGIGWEAQPA